MYKLEAELCHDRLIPRHTAKCTQGFAIKYRWRIDLKPQIKRPLELSLWREILAILRLAPAPARLVGRAEHKTTHKGSQLIFRDVIIRASCAPKRIPHDFWRCSRHANFQNQFALADYYNTRAERHAVPGGFRRDASLVGALQLNSKSGSVCDVLRAPGISVSAVIGRLLLIVSLNHVWRIWISN